MVDSDEQEKGELVLVPLREIRRARNRLTEAQARVLSALFAGYVVCLSRDVSMGHHEQVLIGNGSRLASITVDSLQWRGLIEAEYLHEPHLPPGYPEHWRKRLLVFKLTEEGKYEVIRQRLQFVPEEVVFPLPFTVKLLLEEKARYEIRHSRLPDVAIRGVVPLSDKLGWQVHLTHWRRVVAYNETDNLLGLNSEESGEDEAAPLLWVRPPKPVGLHFTSSVRVRLRPV
jgi:hypothetical protein